MSYYIECPHCDHLHEPSDDHESNVGKYKCIHCEKSFLVGIDYYPDYTTRFIEENA